MMRMQAALLVLVLPALALAFAPSQGSSSVAFATRLRPSSSTTSTSTLGNSQRQSALSLSSSPSSSSPSSSSPSSTVTPPLSEGILKTITKEGLGKPVKLGDIATVKYTCYLPDDANVNANAASTATTMATTLPFAKSSRQKMVIGDGTMIDGWERAIRGMKVGERSIIRITDPVLAYGVAGVPPLVPANAVVEMDVEILDSQPASMNIDFDSLAMADSTPRTANDIARAYQDRQAAKPQGPELEGLEFWIAKAKKFYFFGLFEGETGEKAPWFLRPSITFPLAFAIVGAAFWVSYIGGAINVRGAQNKDELDEIVLSSTTMIHPTVMLAMNDLNALFASTVVDV